MKYFPLVWAGLWRKPARTILTLLSVAVAFLLFGMLHGVIAGFESGIDQLSDTRLRVQSRAGILSPLPLAHLPSIESIEGVEATGYAVIFPAWYQEQTRQVGAAAFQVDRFFETFTELTLKPEYAQAMLANRRGALIGEDLALANGWKVGDTVTLTAFFYQQEDGSKDWTFDIVGTYRFMNDKLPSNEFWFHYEYLDEARVQAKGTVNLYFVTFDDVMQAARIAEEIDSRFINSAYPTITENEKEWMRSRVESIGNIEFFVNAIIGAVLFTLLFLTGNTMMQSVRERIPEFAVLRTYGYTSQGIISLMLAEAALLCGLAALLGLALASIVIPRVFAGIGVGEVPMPFVVFRDGLVIAMVLAVLSTVPPALRAGRLKVVDALAGRQ